jgi:Protein of unknown function (DUF1091)
MKHGRGITPYYNTMINSTIEICNVLNGTDPNPIAKWIFDALSEKISKGFFHPCPYVGQITANNVSIETTDVSSQFLRGRYKIFFRAFDEKDDNVITFKLEAETP